ncbi:hypothetical protein [Bradyrhizobium sp. CCGB20]|uniref:hypothetical protein n=2 Tax=unclassified Bradyrhizobium TaxID=2631580 RepID=UPI0020B42D9E|nr:hypothetical protein [Bradyrhizobium sp. CCGB20]MCP3401537.1 hypothetical protein [Bradyrhizobium sp. CCGB20]
MGVERHRPPKYWRMRAEEFRAKADNAEHPPVKASLRKVAETYEELARRAEKIRTIRDVDGTSE